MPKSNHPLLSSFSFRTGALIFCALSITLLTLRVIMYTQSINTAYQDIRLLLDAHQVEISEDIERYGLPSAKELVDGIIEDNYDSHLYLALKQGDVLSGNLEHWPQIDLELKGYQEVLVPEYNGKPPIHLLTKTVQYPNDVILLVGYDLERVQLLRHTLLRALIENLALAFLLSLLISLFIVWLLNRHFRIFNTACDRIMTGELDHRVHTQGSYDEFDKLAHNINRMLDWNTTLISTVKDSTNAIAHDMRTPLSRLRLELRALSERPKLDPDTRTQVLEHVERVDGLIEMFENILNIAQAEARSSTELFEPVNITQLVRDVLDFYQPIIEEKSLTLHAHISNAPILLKGDKQLLGQAVVNLVDNACKYTPEGGTLEISLHSKAAQVMLVVQDNGIGIAPEFLEKAKQRFFRADASRHTHGHGLGLSLVAAVATLHRGVLQLEHAQPAGLKATLTLHRDTV